MRLLILPLSGLFMTDSADSVKRAWFYCRKCHANLKDYENVMKCDCKKGAVRQLELSRQTTRRRRKTFSGGGSGNRDVSASHKS